MTINEPGPINVRLSPAMLARLDKLVPTLRGYKPSRSDAIREAIEVGLGMLESRVAGASKSLAPQPAPRHIADTFGAGDIPPLGPKPRAPKKAAPKAKGSPKKKARK